MSEEAPLPPPAPEAKVHQRRKRYAGKHPRKFAEKYKEQNPAQFPETVAKVLASGKTPAGTHRPIMVSEILAALRPQPGEWMVDCTLGYGGHAAEILARLQPGGRLWGLDVDPIEQPKTEARLRTLGFGAESFTAIRSNYAGLLRLVSAEPSGQKPNGIVADLGVSSMQIDDPARGFSVKLPGPLDMRMNPERGQSASAWLQKVSPEALARALTENSDEPHAERLAAALAGKLFETTTALRREIEFQLARVPEEDRELSVRRVFQALRIAVNDEFSALDTFLRHLPDCLVPGGRVAILTFHSGEDRRVKKAFQEAHRAALYRDVAREVIRAGADERHQNPRATSAKLRWAIRA